MDLYSTAADNETHGPFNATDYTTGMITPLYISVIFVVHAPLWILNVGGNSLVILAVYRERHLREPTYFLIAALAVADIFLPLFAYPPSIYAVVVENQFTCSAGTRTYFFFLTYACAAASFFHIMAVTFERYIGVTRPLHYRKIVTRRRIVGVVVLIWVTSFGLATIALPMGRVKDPMRPICKRPKPSSLFSFLVFIFCMMGMIFISLVYLRIYHIAKQHWRVMQKDREKAAELSKETKHSMDDNGNNDEAQLRATKTIGIIVVFFVICWLPMATRYLFEGIRNSLHLDSTTWISIKRCSETFGLLNGAINPLVYAHRNSYFRRAFKSILKSSLNMPKKLTCPKKLQSRKGSLSFLKARSSLSTDTLS